jgi:hypothetical protein
MSLALNAKLPAASAAKSASISANARWRGEPMWVRNRAVLANGRLPHGQERGDRQGWAAHRKRPTDQDEVVMLLDRGGKFDGRQLSLEAVVRCQAKEACAVSDS